MPTLTIIGKKNEDIASYINKQDSGPKNNNLNSDIEKLEEKQIKNEYQDLLNYKKELNQILKSKSNQSKILNKEIICFREKESFRNPKEAN